jgi:hypothetical protein
VGDAVATLSAEDRRLPAFVDIAEIVLGMLGTAVLQLRLSSPACVLVLRRLAAALLPPDGDAMGLPAPVTAAAATLFRSILAHPRFLPTLRSAAASPAPLPPAAAMAQIPLASLLQLADLKGAGCGADLSDPSTWLEGSPPPEEGGGSGVNAAVAALVKREVCELVDTLLSLHPSGSAPEAELRALLPTLMAGYGGSLSSADRAVWSLAQSVNRRLVAVRRGVGLEEVDELEALVGGVLAEAG